MFQFGGFWGNVARFPLQLLFEKRWTRVHTRVVNRARNYIDISIVSPTRIN